MQMKYELPPYTVNDLSQEEILTILIDEYNAGDRRLEKITGDREWIIMAAYLRGIAKAMRVVKGEDDRETEYSDD